MFDKKSMKEVENTRQELLKEWKSRHFVNMLDEMMETQKRFAGKFFHLDDVDLDRKQDLTKEMILCVLDECSELLNWTKWKHWKNYDNFKVDELEIRYEIIDILHFLLNLMLIWGMTSRDVFSMYIAKNRENQNRQKGGY